MEGQTIAICLTSQNNMEEEILEGTYHAYVLWNSSIYWKVCGLPAVRRCYAEGGGDCYAKL
jgi:hypothetical protein